MDETDSRSSSLTRSPSPEEVPVQPDHFWGQDDIQCPPSPHSDGRTWLDPEDDPFAQRGIPVFKPTMDEFKDFEQYMKRVECWGLKSGIVKVIPPQEWTDSLPPTKNQLPGVVLKSPIEQNLIGRTGRFRAQNVERKSMSLRQWVEKCREDDYRAPGVKEIGLPGERAPPPPIKYRTHGRGRNNKAPTETSTPAQSEPPEDGQTSIPSPPQSDKETREASVGEGSGDVNMADEDAEAEADSAAPEAESTEPKRKTRRGLTKEEKQAKAAEDAVLDDKFLEDFDPRTDWLPKDTKPEDYTPEFCRKLEHHFWRNCGIGKPAWYGADTAGSLFTDETTSWNVGHLPSMLARLLPASGGGLPGVNMPYLYFGMWRATFAWHVEDMDLFSINYIHFGAPKFWYAIPQARAKALEQTMKSYFPGDIKHCPQFLRHKSFLASPKLLSQSSCKPNTCVQREGEFIITYPMGYHAGINLGLNCAESVNFALDSWLDLARKAKVCKCIPDSVRIDVDALMAERDAEARGETYQENAGVSGSRNMASSSKPRKRKVPASGLEDGADPSSLAKKRSKTKVSPSNPAGKTLSVKLTLGPRPVEPVFGCCLCVDTSEEDLLRVNDAPHASEAGPSHAATGYWRAHASCATVVTETWVDEVDLPDGAKEMVVFGVDTIPKDRWHLKCTICTKPKAKSHGAPIQCTKGKCPKAFHVSCARQSDPSSANGVVLALQDVQREILIADPIPPPPPAPAVDETAGVDPTVPFGMPAPDAVSPSAELQRRLFKIIHKFEYNLLCHQHNPATYEAKKNSKADRQLTQLLSLPPMSRIKVRVSAGVFEVSLVNVIQDQSMVEVVWDQGQKRTFKFSSIVFGQTKDDIVVGHKPTEVAPVPDHAALMAAAGVSIPPVGISPTGPSHVGNPNTWSYSYTGQPHGHYVNPTSFINVTPPVPTPALPMVYPRPPLTHASSSSSSIVSTPALPAGAPADTASQPPAESSYGNSYASNLPKVVYKNSALPPPPPQAQHERFRVQWKEPYQDPRTWNPPPQPSGSQLTVDHYPRVQYYSPDDPHLPMASDQELQPMYMDPEVYVDDTGALTPSGLVGFPST